MRQLGTYADNLVVAASSMFLGVCIRIVSATGEPILINACDSEANVDSMLTMGYLRDKHYYASVPGLWHSSFVSCWNYFIIFIRELIYQYCVIQTAYRLHFMMPSCVWVYVVIFDYMIKHN